VSEVGGRAMRKEGVGHEFNQSNVDSSLLRFVKLDFAFSIFELFFMIYQQKS
jgi:hypothetical protein